MTRRIAVYPGTFDPIHQGHMDIAQRAARLFDTLVVAVYAHSNKRRLFSTEERTALAQTVFQDYANIEVQAYTGLTVDFARSLGAQVLVRGLRVISDFELEYQMALTNRQLCPALDTICLMTGSENAFLSSSVIKEVFMAGGDVSEMVHPAVESALHRKQAQLGDARNPVAVVSLRD